VSGIHAMSRPSNSTSDIVAIGLVAAVAVGALIDKELALQCGLALIGLVDLIKELAFEVALIGLIDLIAAGVMLLAVALGLRALAPCLAPWGSRRRARRREAHLKRLRDTVCARGNNRDRLLPSIAPRISSDQGGDPPRPFDPQAAARFREVLEFGDPYIALRAAGLRKCDVHAWLDAGLSWAPEADPRRDFAIQILEFILRWQSRRGPMRASEPHVPMLGGVAHPERRDDGINVSLLLGVEYPG
jgi:hypothetical protein